MQIRLTLNNRTRQALLKRLHQAYQGGNLRLIRRIHCSLYLADGKTVAEVARLLNVGEQTVYDYVQAFLLLGLHSLNYKCPSGRPSRLTQTQRNELGKLIDAGPEKAGYDEGCWTAVLIQDLIEKRFGVVYHPQYVAELLKHRGFSYQKGRLSRITWTKPHEPRGWPKNGRRSCVWRSRNTPCSCLATRLVLPSGVR